MEPRHENPTKVYVCVIFGGIRVCDRGRIQMAQWHVIRHIAAVYVTGDAYK